MNRLSTIILTLILYSITPFFHCVKSETSKHSTLDYVELRKSVVEVGGQLELGYNQDINTNLDLNDNEDKLRLEPSGEFSISFLYSRQYSSHLALKFGRELEIDDGKADQFYKTSVDLDEAYFQFSDMFNVKGIIEDTTLTLGRFSAKDSREWLYDSSVDGILVNLNFSKINTNIGFSWNREELIGSDLLNHNDDDTVSNIILFTEHKPFKSVKLKLSVFGLVRNDSSSDNDSPQFLALRSRGELFDQRLDFWTDFAWAKGKHEDENIDGYGLDIGAILRFKRRLSPYVTLGYAMGSGDGDKDTDFRQSGLQGNSAKLGGVTSIKYYGELMDPELSNLHIATAGIGFRPRPNISVDLLYHHYRQDHALKKLRKNELDINPDGISRQIGSEVNLILGMEKMGNVEADLTLGYFQPGRAFGDTAEDSYIVKLGASYNF